MNPINPQSNAEKQGTDKTELGERQPEKLDKHNLLQRFLLLVGLGKCHVPHVVPHVVLRANDRT